MAVDETSRTAENARRSHQARARARPRDLTERLNVFAKAVGLGVLIALVGIGAFGRFYSIRFNGLASADAMDAGQIAEQLRYGRGLSTRVIRPLALSYAGVTEDGVMPEMLSAPLYPLLLSWLFKVRGGGDASVVIFNGLAFLLTGWVLYAIARRLWDKTTGLVVVILYFVSVEALGNVLTASGASLTGLLIALAIWAALRQRETLEASQEQGQELADRWWFIGIWANLSGWSRFFAVGAPLSLPGHHAGPPAATSCSHGNCRVRGDGAMVCAQPDGNSHPVPCFVPLQTFDVHRYLSRKLGVSTATGSGAVTGFIHSPSSRGVREESGVGPHSPVPSGGRRG